MDAADCQLVAGVAEWLFGGVLLGVHQVSLLSLSTVVVDVVTEWARIACV